MKNCGQPLRYFFIFLFPFLIASFLKDGDGSEYDYAVEAVTPMVIPQDLPDEKVSIMDIPLHSLSEMKPMAPSSYVLKESPVMATQYFPGGTAPQHFAEGCFHEPYVPATDGQPITIKTAPRARRLPSKPRLQGIKKKVLKREVIEDKNVALPTGFENVLERATSYDPTVEYEFEMPPRRDGRRCETKVMLQTVDGQLFNKFFEVDDIRKFVERLKALRAEYGFSQADVGAALGRRYGSDISQTTISRFEGLVLSHSNMCKLRPSIENWIADIQKAIESGIDLDELRRACKNGEFWPSLPSKDPSSTSTLVPPVRKRRKRTSLEEGQRFALDTYFDVNRRPTNPQMGEIARTLGLSFEVGFCLFKLWIIKYFTF